jgi:ubiquinone/menaquinone biosynthesis C-methylase UbiE
MDTKWPKVFPPLTPEQEAISNDFMRYWHEELASKPRYGLIEKFNHGYIVKNAPKKFLHTLEIGAGLGEHLAYENLTDLQKQNYVVLEIRENMAEKIKEHNPDIRVQVGDCQDRLSFSDNYFDRVLAIHVLEHLPNLPAAIKEIYRVCHKEHGVFSVAIPCEGGWAYTLARRLSAQRLFERRYQQPYRWFIEREHINQPHEILEELKPYFIIEKRAFFPFHLPWVNVNLCIGLTLRPRCI